MKKLTKTHRQKKDAEVELAFMQLHCALLAHAIQNCHQDQAEFQLDQLVKLVHGPLAYVQREPIALVELTPAVAA